MKQLKLFIVLVGFLAFACSEDDQPDVINYTEESFPDLTVSDLESIETPFASTFSSGGRVRQTAITIDEVITKLQSIFAGATIIEVEKETERGLAVWEAKVKMSSGGIIKIKVVEDLGKIIKIKGKTGPFDYDFDPEGSFITFSEAKQLALEVAPGDLMSWSLELEENNQWEYEFHIVSDSRRVEVEVRGFTAEVITVKEKHEGEDDDNDGEEDEGEKEDEMEHGDDDNGHTAPTSDISTFVANIFDGVIAHSERHEFEGKVYWEVYVKNQAGAVVKIKMKEEPLSLLKIEGEVGPFDYAVEPGGDLKTFGEVVDIIFNEVQADIKQWRLDHELENGQDRWEYEFRLEGDGVRYEFTVDAHSGEITEFKEND